MDDEFGTTELDLGIPEKPLLTKRERSKKDEDDAKQLVYRRVNSAARSLCDDCVKEREIQQHGGVGSTAYMRIDNNTIRHLCMRHSAIWREHDGLAALRGG